MPGKKAPPDWDKRATSNKSYNIEEKDSSSFL
jgi:hypothetical protein